MLRQSLSIATGSQWWRHGGARSTLRVVTPIPEKLLGRAIALNIYEDFKIFSTFSIRRRVLKQYPGMAEITKEDIRKTVLITGCSPGGIGHSLAKTFHEHGLRVFATARSADTLSSLSSLGIETLSLTVDSELSIQSSLAEVEARTKGRGLDYLVNNAGRSYTMPALDVDLDQVRATFETNLFSIMRLVQVFSPLLIEARGTIVMIGSLAGVLPYVFGSVYNASKAALHAYSNTLRVEMEPLGVKVITIVTGGVKSRISRVGRVLPENSFYSELDEQYKRRQGHSQEGAMSNEDYARSVVRQVLPGGGPWPWRWLLSDARKRWIWEGNKSWQVWLYSGGWIWSGFFDLYMTRIFQLWRLRRRAGDKL
jgi:1-acylglycerone phosphate reductase